MDTIACLAHGIDLCYPPEHKKLHAEIATKGLLISEHAPGVRAIKQFFPARNRIISGLSQAVLIVQAGRKSGALITAEFAAMQGRDVMAIPGSIYSAEQAGCNNLIKDGAIPILSYHDILDNFGINFDSTDCTEVNKNTSQIIALEDKLAIAIIIFLKNGDINENILAQKLNISVTTLKISIAKLEILGLIKSSRGMLTLTI